MAAQHTGDLKDREHAKQSTTERARKSGQIIQRGERNYLVRIFLGRDPQTGKRRYHNHRVRGTRKDAQTYLNAQLRKLDLGEFIEPSAMLCSEFFRKWLTTSVKQRVRTRSYDLYDATLTRYVIPELGDKRLSDVRPIDLQHLYGKLQEKGLKSNTVRHVHMLISNAFKQAVRWRMLLQNPASLVDPPRYIKPEMQALDREQARALLKALEGDRYQMVFAFMLATGCRPAEVFGLKWSDVDWQARTITIQRALYWKRHVKGWEITEPKTASSRRTIPLGEALTRRLAEHKRHQAEERLRRGADWQNHDFIFTKLYGGPLDLETLRDQLDAALTRAELPAIRIYDLRHSCASILMAEGLNPKIVSERLGHTDIRLTLQTYSHVSKGMQEEASEKLENALFG